MSVLEGKRLRDEGIARTTADEDAEYVAWQESFARVFRIVFEQGRPFNCDEITAVIGHPPGHPNRIPAAWRSNANPLLREGRLVELGLRHVSRTAGRARRAVVYQKVSD